MKFSRSDFEMQRFESPPQPASPSLTHTELGCALQEELDCSELDAAPAGSFQSLAS